MECTCCKKKYPADKLITQLTIFSTEEHYCKECWDELADTVI